MELPFDIITTILKTFFKFLLQTKIPDKVHVNFTTSSKKQIEIKKGKNLLAGTSEDGKNIIYKVDKTILINKAKICEIIGFEFVHDKNTEQYFLNLFDSEKTY